MNFSNAAYQQLNQYAWPGNVRELENVIERAVILCREHCIDVSDLALSKARMNNGMPKHAKPEKLSLDEYFVSFVKQYQAEYNETELAKLLGISRKNLWERRQRLNIPARK